VIYGTCFSASLERADSLFAKKAFEDALVEYTGVLEKLGSARTHHQAFIRICCCLVQLDRSAEAAQRVLFAPVPDEPEYRARILALKTEVLSAFLEDYRDRREGKVTVLPGTVSVFSMKRTQVSKRIESAYKSLWDIRGLLAEMPLQSQDYYFDTKDLDLISYPTFFDYLVLSWTGFLLGAQFDHGPKEPPRTNGDMLLTAEFSRPVSYRDPPGLLAAEVMEAAGHLGGEREEAAERWRIRRLLLPLTHPDFFDLSPVAGDTAAVDTMDLPQYRKAAAEILSVFVKDFKTDGARAEAALEEANILDTLGEHAQAVELCEELERNYGKTDAALRATALRADIQRPAVWLKAKTAMYSSPQPFIVTARNLKRVYLRMYPIDPYAYRQLFRKSEYYCGGAWCHLFMYPDNQWLLERLPHQPYSIEWSVATGDTGDCKEVTVETHPPRLEPGICLVVACADSEFRPDRSTMVCGFTNITDFVLFGSAGFTTYAEDAYYDFVDGSGPGEMIDTVFRFYALDGRTGATLEGVSLDLGWTGSCGEGGKACTLRTDEEGFACIQEKAKVSEERSQYHGTEPLAQRGRTFAYWRNGMDFSYCPLPPVELFIQTDRSLYRPGDEACAKVVAVRRVAGGFRTLGSSDTVKFKASDAKGKEFFHETVQLTDFGSASVRFKLPEACPLGGFSLVAECRGRKVGVQSVVEEYRRPELRVLLEPPSSPWKYGMPVEVTGSVTHYPGSGVPNAPIRYSVERDRRVPPPYLSYWHDGGPIFENEEIAAGETRTDSHGRFTIPFTSAAPPQREFLAQVPDMARFHVEVEARVAGDSTVRDGRTYNAGKTAIYMTLEPDEGFYFEKKPMNIESRRFDVNDEPTAGSGIYEVFRLNRVSVKLPEDWAFWTDGYTRWMPSLDVQFADVPDGESVLRGQTAFDSYGKAVIRIPGLAAGIYRIKVSSPDDWGDSAEQSRILVVTADTTWTAPLEGVSVTLAEKAEYAVGDTARFLIGSVSGTCDNHVELWVGQYFLSCVRMRGTGPLNVMRVPITERMKGGFTLRWFGVKNFQVQNGEVTVSVPWKDKKLKVSLDLPGHELEPGQKVTLGIRTSDRTGAPASAEVLAFMYDRSFENFWTTYGRSWLDRLYVPRYEPAIGYQSMFRPFTTSPYRELRPDERVIRLPFLNEPRLLGTYVRYAEEPGPVVGDGAAPPESRAGGNPMATAFFEPNIITDTAGSASFTFTAPDHVASWRLKVFALTRDGKEASVIEDIETKKDRTGDTH
jgi:hypothetical protein